MGSSDEEKIKFTFKSMRCIDVKNWFLQEDEKRTERISVNCLKFKP